MKKSLLALAVLGAFAAGAQAQTTNVTIGGLVQANLKSYKISSINRTVRGATATANNEYRVDDDYNSRFWLTGSEDLGGGLSAIFYAENRFNSDTRQSPGTATGAGLADGDTWVGVRGGFGQVTVGKHSWMSVQGLLTEFQVGSGNLSAMPTAMLGTFSILNQAGGYLDITRRVNSVTYRTPNFSGFSAVVGVSAASAGNEGNMACTGTGLINPVVNAGVIVPPATANGATAACPTAVNATNGNQATYNDGREFYLQATYLNGPFYGNLAYRNHKLEGNTVLNNKQTRFSGHYKLPMGLKVGLQLDRATAAGNNAQKRTAWQIPVSYAMGNHTILGSYTKAGDLSNTNNTGAKMYTIGYDYALSKRTNVGVYYSRLDNDTGAAYQPFLAGTSFTGSAPTLGETATTMAVGIKHTF